MIRLLNKSVFEQPSRTNCVRKPRFDCTVIVGLRINVCHYLFVSRIYSNYIFVFCKQIIFRFLPSSFSSFRSDFAGRSCDTVTVSKRNMNLTGDVLMSQSSEVVLRKKFVPSVAEDNRKADDVIMSSSGIDYPPNIAISPGSCKSPYCCTSPGFCNFPFHNYKAPSVRSRASSGDPTQDGVARTRSDPFPRDQVFIRDSAEPEAPELPLNSRRQSVPSLCNHLPVVKSDDISLPGVPDHEEFINSFPIMKPSSPTTLSTAESSIFNDPLMVDVTGNDVMGLLKTPKIEIIENDFLLPNTETKVIKPPIFCSKATIRRSPPPPNVTLNPEKHKRSTLPPSM